MPKIPTPSLAFPHTGRSREDILTAMRSARDHDLDWREGRVFGLVYHASEEVTDLLKNAHELFFSENGLNPTAFPSLRRFEAEVVAMVASLMGGETEIAGNLTSGGTESLLLAVLSAREWARRRQPEITRPEMVLPASAHPAFDKAAHYFGVKVIRVPPRTDFRADPQAMEAAITPNTILIVASAPSYPHGLVDPIAEIGEVAQRHNLLFHVDACVGGMMLPFARRLGYPVPFFDFCVPGVTSLSVDLHKYGYAAKGASLILYRSAALRREMLFAAIDWWGGIYASPTLAGTRPGGPIAAAWAVINYLGEEGYLELARSVMDATRKVHEAVQSIPGIQILSSPEMSLLAIVSDTLDIYEVGDELSQLGWQLDRQHLPPSLHMTITPAHAPVIDQFNADLREAVTRVQRPSLRRAAMAMMVKAANLLARRLPERWATRMTGMVSNSPGGSDSGLPQRSAPLYGLIGSLPNRRDVKELVLDLLEEITRLPSDRI